MVVLITLIISNPKELDVACLFYLLTNTKGESDLLCYTVLWWVIPGLSWVIATTDHE